VYKVLLLDDRPQTRIPLTEKLQATQNMDVYPCRSIHEANDVWNVDGDKMDAIVFDVMMPSMGLDEELRKKTKAGLLSGWIWLWHSLNQEGKLTHPAEKKCLVIYSAYSEDFQAYINSNRPSDLEIAFSTSIKCIPKGRSENEDEVVEYLKKYLSQKYKKQET